MESLIEKIRAKKLFVVFTWGTRILLAIGFLPSGLKKAMGERFTLLGIDTPVGFFFEALYQTGFYWNFIGVAQLFAAFLLVIPRTTTLGVVVYFPIIVNIFLITASMHFRGTVYITGMMLLGSLYLLIWDYKKLKPVFAKG